MRSFSKIAFGQTSLPLVLVERPLALELSLALILVGIILRSYAFDSWGCACASSSNKMRWDFVYRLKPFVVFVEKEFSLSDLISDC
jgi:hypothetical protein